MSEHIYINNKWWIKYDNFKKNNVCFICKQNRSYTIYECIICGIKLGRCCIIKHDKCEIYKNNCDCDFINNFCCFL